MVALYILFDQNHSRCGICLWWLPPAHVGITCASWDCADLLSISQMQRPYHLKKNTCLLYREWISKVRKVYQDKIPMRVVNIGRHVLGYCHVFRLFVAQVISRSPRKGSPLPYFLINFDWVPRYLATYPFPCPNEAHNPLKPINIRSSALTTTNSLNE